MRRAFGILIGLGVTAAVSMRVIGGEAPKTSSMAVPKYNDTGELIRPEGYREWVFVGSSLGLSYTEPAKDEGPGLFHNVYIQPEAYREYMATGRFPEKTMLAMELFEPGTKTPPNLGGHFEAGHAGFEVALKDHERFKEGWAYFNFTGGPSGPRSSAKAFPKGLCFECHAKHAATDNVFTQFYPILKREAPKAEGKP